jgi:hypothetical protein
MYKLFKTIGKNEIVTVKRLSDNAFIPFDPANTDYQTYLEWLAAGNQPLPADAEEGNEPLPYDEPET